MLSGQLLAAGLRSYYVKTGKYKSHKKEKKIVSTKNRSSTKEVPRRDNQSLKKAMTKYKTESEATN